MRDVAGIAAHIQRHVPAASRRDIHSDGMAGQAEILFGACSTGCFEKLELVVGLVRVVALEAVPDRGLVYCPLDAGGVLVGMAGEAERRRRGGGQLDPGHVLVYPDFVATHAARRDRRVHVLPLGFVAVALDALRGVRVFVQGHRMNIGKQWCRQQQAKDK